MTSSTTPSIANTMHEKVEQCMLLAKGVRGLALVDLIHKATSEPGLYTFGQLLALPSVQELKEDHTPQLASAYTLLHLFAYGTWNDSKQHSMLHLTPPQQLKLKALTVATLAASHHTLSYDLLMENLDISEIRQLEDLLITECIYNGIVSGRLDQRNRHFVVHDAFPRDVPPSQVPSLIHTLESWLHSARSVMNAIDDQVNWTSDALTASEREHANRKKMVDDSKAAVHAALGVKGMKLHAAIEGPSAMSLDEDAVIMAMDEHSEDDFGEDVGILGGGGGGGGQHKHRHSRVPKRRR